MNYKLLSIAFAACAVMSCSCEKSENNANNVTPCAAAAGECKIAYVEIDSLMSQYQFVKDYTVVLQQKMEGMQSTLEGKQRELQQQAQAMQRKYESGGFSSAQELQNAQQNLATAEQNLQALGERLSADFAEEQLKYQQALRDSIQNFISEFNKDKRYDYIMMRGGDNMLYANPDFDITQQVVNGLNENYKPSAE